MVAPILLLLVRGDSARPRVETYLSRYDVGDFQKSENHPLIRKVLAEVYGVGDEGGVESVRPRCEAPDLGVQRDAALFIFLGARRGVFVPSSAPVEGCSCLPLTGVK